MEKLLNCSDLLSAMDCLLKFHMKYEDPQTIMIFVKENISVAPSRIIGIREIS